MEFISISVNVYVFHICGQCVLVTVNKILTISFSSIIIAEPILFFIKNWTFLDLISLIDLIFFIGSLPLSTDSSNIVRSVFFCILRYQYSGIWYVWSRRLEFIGKYNSSKFIMKLIFCSIFLLKVYFFFTILKLVFPGKRNGSKIRSEYICFIYFSVMDKCLLNSVLMFSCYFCIYWFFNIFYFTASK